MTEIKVNNFSTLYKLKGKVRFSPLYEKERVCLKIKYLGYKAKVQWAEHMPFMQRLGSMPSTILSPEYDQEIPLSAELE